MFHQSSFKWVVLLAVLVAACAPVTAATPAPPTSAPTSNAPEASHTASHLIVAPNDLKWADVPALPPGAKIAVIEGKLTDPGFATVRLKFPADYKVPPHWHPVVERVTILAGMLNMGLGDTLDIQQSTALPAGSIMIIQPQTHHFVWTTEETIVQLNVVTPWGITYVNPADDPRKK
jgi:quercetin dioxygenase-like cupin family protein